MQVGFVLKKRAKQKECYIIATCTYAKGKRIRWSTRIKIDPDRWIKAKQKSKDSSVNSQLREFEQLIESTAERFNELSPRDFTKELDYQKGWAKRPEDLIVDDTSDLLEFTKDYIKDCIKRRIPYNTYKAYESIQAHLTEFANTYHRGYRFEDIDWQFRNQLVKWYTFDIVVNSKQVGHSQNTISRNLRRIGHLMKEARKRGFHNNTIYKEDDWPVTEVTTNNKVRLTFEEIDNLIQLDLSHDKVLDDCRDLFVVGAYSGLRFSDWHKVTRDNIVVRGGIEYLDVIADKTDEEVSIPLFPQLRRVLEKHQFKLPDITIEKFNLRIKDVAKAAIPDATFKKVISNQGRIIKDAKALKCDHISSHSGRKSFATNFYLQGVNAALLMKITGHETESVFYKYIDIDSDESAKKFAEAVRDKL